MEPVKTNFENKEYRGKTTVDRFWEKVDKTSENACWLWMWHRNTQGYGSVRVGGGFFLAHRLSWMINRGPIPKGIRVLHDCPTGDNPACVNPAHLWLGTIADNVQDAISKGQWKANCGERIGTHRLSEKDVREIRYLYALGGVTKKALADRFGVSDTMICNIVNRRWWKHL